MMSNTALKTTMLMAAFALGAAFPAQANETPGNDAEDAKSPERLAWEARIPEKLQDRPAFAYVEEDPDFPRVLIIGDSISIGYTAAVRQELEGEANVLRIPANGGPTMRGLENIDAWLGEEPWDVIHFNWGLHDLKRLNEEGEMDVNGDWQVPPDAYAENLEALVKRLKKTGARLIWCNTTPVPEGASGRIKGEDVKYNAVAAEVMERQNVPTNNLYAYVLPELEKHQRSKNVHFTPEGSAFLGKRVATVIRKALNGELEKPEEAG